MLDPLYKAIGWVLAFYYGIIPNLGIAIILLTITVMLLLFPLTAKQAKSMLAMQQLQPEMKKLQAKYKGDRQKLNEEMMKLYQEHKVNPLGGCLPLLAQMPVFISLFSVLRSVQKNVPTDSDLYADLCGTANPCTDPNHLRFLGMDLTVTPLNATGGFLSVLPYFVLVALIVLTGLVQSRQTARTTPAGANPQMQMIGKVLPIVFGVISLNFPAGLCVYFLVSNVWRLGQQEWIFRNIHLPHRERMAAKDDKSKGGATEAKAVEAPAADETPSSDAGAPPVRKPVQPRRPTKATPAQPSEPAPEGTPPSAKEAAPTRTPGGGLRSLFRLPPAPNGGDVGTGGAVKPAREASPGAEARTSTSGANRPQAARKRNRKKRKR